MIFLYITVHFFIVWVLSLDNIIMRVILMEICVAKKTCLRYFHEINQHLKYPLLLARQGFLFFMLNQCLCLDWR